MHLKYNYKVLLPLKLLVTVIVLVYLPLFFGFFQQDEWSVFGRLFAVGQEDKFSVFNFFVPTEGHYIPLSQIFTYLTFSFFRLDFSFYALLSLLLHIIVVLEVYIFSRMLITNKTLSMLASLLFGGGASGFQATAWVVADINTHGATLFGLLSLILFFHFLKKGKEKFFWFSLVSFLIALLFKEIVVALFLILPLAYFLFRQKKHGAFKYPLVLLGLAVPFILLRIFPALVTNQESVTPLPTQTFKQIIYNVGTFPFKGISQTIIPSEILLKFSYKIGSYLSDGITGTKKTTAYDLFVQKRILEVINLTFAILVIALLFIMSRDNSSDFRKSALFLLIFIMTNSVVYALSPERTGIIPIIDSRNLYFPSIGTAVLLTLSVSKVVGGKLKQSLILLIFILFNIFLLTRELQNLSQIGKGRKAILNQIKATYPDLPEITVFYTQSDTSYYGLPIEETIMPFQSGFGQTLLVWYYPTETWSKEFLENKFLWKITEQGYKEANGRGYGYFRDFRLLKQTVEKYKIFPDAIIAFSWEGKEGKLSDITAETRAKINDEVF